MQEIKSIAAIEQELTEDFAMFDNWEDKYEYLIDLGKKLPAMNPALKTDDYKIKGCQSSVWIHSFNKDGRIYFEGDSDAMIVKGLVSLMIQVFNAQKPEDIIQAPLDFLNNTGLSSHLAQTRSNGLRAMIKQMKLDASVYGAASTQ